MEVSVECSCDELSKLNVTHPELIEWDDEDMTKNFPRSTWRADEPRRHWEMMLHCEIAMFPRPLPNLPLPTKEARFYWNLYGASGKHEPLYQHELNTAILTALHRMIRRKSSTKDVVLSEQLFKIDTFDYLSRKNLINGLEKYLRQQTAIEYFCIEGLQLTRKEGLRIVSALFKSRKTIKDFYCWRAFKRTEGPLLVDTGHLAGSGIYKDRVPRKRDWFKAIGCLESVTKLSINYSYLATPDGDLLVALSKKIGLHWKWLQLLCSTEEIPVINDPDDGTGGYAIPDISWLEATIWAPSLKVQFVILGIPEYDKHKKFLTKHTPLHSFMLSTLVDLQFRQPWHLDCTLKMIRSWYPKTLVNLYLQLWHHRENLDFDLKKLLPLFPKLKVFEFVGEIRRSETLCAMCCQISDKESKVNYLSFKIQHPINAERRREEWKKDIECLIKCFENTFEEMNKAIQRSSNKDFWKLSKPVLLESKHEYE